MIHHLQHIVDLVAICRLKGIEQVVVSPGSRNAPLIKLFAEEGFKLHSIVDERSAAFFGLGIAQATQKPVVLICTSGTATLNYSSALAEAYYQHIPLIAITADRPEHLIDQQDNQTIRQVNVFDNFVKDSIHLHQPIKDKFELEAQHFAIDKILNNSNSGIKGPVHINVPIAEPFYIDFPAKSESIKISTAENHSITDHSELSKAIAEHDKVMLICGQNRPTAELKTIIEAISEKVIVLAEPISNINGKNIISEIDRLMMQIESLDSSVYNPDLLISFEGPVVSKRLKLWLQKQKAIKHYRIAEAHDEIDTYGNLTKQIIGKPVDILKDIFKNETPSDHSFYNQWQYAYSKNKASHKTAIEKTAYSDIEVFASIFKQTPKNTILHLGNSSPVRYGQLFDLSKCDAVYSNRGVSGIDGCLSTAAGSASQSDRLNLVILGDLSFLYDSNGLWNSKLPKNLKIIVINNEGGGIFRLIPGPTQIESFEEFMETKHPVDISKLTAAFGVDYFKANESTLKIKCKEFFKSENTALLEIKTPRLDNAEIYRSYINQIKNL